jgi:hypothetical protein
MIRKVETGFPKADAQIKRWMTIRGLVIALQASARAARRVPSYPAAIDDVML